MGWGGAVGASGCGETISENGGVSRRGREYDGLYPGVVSGNAAAHWMPHFGFTVDGRLEVTQAQWYVCLTRWRPLAISLCARANSSRREPGMIDRTSLRRDRKIEWAGEPDAIPSAASVDYDWMERVDKALCVVDTMMAEFDDLPVRLSCHVKAIERLADLLKVARSHGNRNLTFAVLTVYDAMYSVYSEDMTDEQAEAVRDAVARLRSMEWDKDTLRGLDRFLRNVGFETVPSDKFVSSNVASRTSRR